MLAGILAGALGGVAPAAAASVPAVCGAHWVAAWAGVPTDAANSTGLTDLIGAGGDLTLGNLKAPLEHATVRAMLTPSIGGSTVRVRLSNRYGLVAVPFAHTTIARQAAGAGVAAVPVEVTFGGRASVTAAPGEDVVSDPVAFSYAGGETLAVSTFVAAAIGKPTHHASARQTSYFTPAGAGDHAADRAGGAFLLHTSSRPLVTGLDVRVDRPFGAVVALGDSITDGFRGLPGLGFPETTVGIDANGRWPDVLAGRLRAAGTPLAVANVGISGNRVLRDSGGGIAGKSFGEAALTRLDADVLRQAGVSTVIWLEGVNDIGQKPGAPASDIIAGYRQGIARMRAAGLRVLMGTLTPTAGAQASYSDATAQAARETVNTWIRTAGGADGYIDFDAAVRDPADPARIAPAYDGGDHLHFSLAGYAALGNAVPLDRLGAPDCPKPSPAPRLNVSAARTLVVGRTTALRVRVRSTGRPVRAAAVRLGAARGRTDARGVAVLRIRPRRAGTRTLVVTKAGTRPSRTVIRVVRRRAA
ncbi:lipase [Paraconexibacter sp. AEG42_29]|uniref:Lipase n=1 Tax=Paraconexibacter sp. AEG42_29 TaxID=2997339 RepID=A0AAU7APQ1_9ACTN